jgi:prepilin-type N-terminal cleavage/methylation domain-containing protein
MQCRSPNEPVRSLVSCGFTLIEIVIAVFILVMLLLLAVPSLNGVLADKRLHRSLDGFNALVIQAQQKSVAEHRAYLIVWEKDNVILRPEAFAKDEEQKPTATFQLERGSALVLRLPAALTKKAASEWIFWPTGICEPAIVRFEGASGTWTANYSPLTGHGELTKYAAR